MTEPKLYPWNEPTLQCGACRCVFTAEQVRTVAAPRQPTLRDRFAMAAHTGLIASPDCLGEADEFAEWAYQHADAMLTERQKQPAPETQLKKEEVGDFLDEKLISNLFAGATFVAAFDTFHLIISNAVVHTNNQAPQARTLGDLYRAIQNVREDAGAMDALEREAKLRAVRR